MLWSALLVASTSISSFVWGRRIEEQNHIQETSRGSESGCHYASLALVARLGSSDQEVEVFFCGKPPVTLRRKQQSVAAQNALRDVNWLDTRLLGAELDGGDIAYLNKYTGNAITVLKGQAPTIREDPRSEWISDDRAELTQEVIKWDIGFATALNKLPWATSEDGGAMTLFRGQWEMATFVSGLKAYASGYLLSSDLSTFLYGFPVTSEEQPAFQFPWFQSCTTDYSHSSTFIAPEVQPEACRPTKSDPTDCIEKKAAYPVIYKIVTRRSKDVRRWNAHENELILLPNTPLRIDTVAKVENDPFLSMTTEEIVAWLGKRHPSSDGQKTYGPFDELGGLVKRQGWTGAQFLDGIETWGVRLLAGDVPLDVEGFDQALKTRFRLPCREACLVPFYYHSKAVPYYYEVTVSDAAWDALKASPESPRASSGGSGGGKRGAKRHGPEDDESPRRMKAKF